MEDWWRDVQYGARMLLEVARLHVVAVLTLALGIGANTAIFSVVNAVLLRAAALRRGRRLVFLTEWSEQVPNMSFSVANFKDCATRTRVVRVARRLQRGELHPDRRGRARPSA